MLAAKMARQAEAAEGMAVTPIAAFSENSRALSSTGHGACCTGQLTGENGGFHYLYNRETGVLTTGKSTAATFIFGCCSKEPFQ
jgi:hypothetical protein